jgi:signal transduction histidine kinase
MVLFGVILVVIITSILFTNKLLEKVVRQQKVAENIFLWASDLSFLSVDYLIYHESQQMKRLRTKYDAVASEIDKLAAGSTAEKALITNIRNNQTRLKDVFTNVALYPNRMPGYHNPDFDPAFFQVSWSRLAIQSQSLVADTLKLSTLLRQKLENLSQARNSLMYTMAGMFGVYIFISYLFTCRRILESIKKLQTGTNIIGSGDLDFVINEKRNDEIGELSLAFNRMTTNIKNFTASKISLQKEIAEKLVEERSRALINSQAELEQAKRLSDIGTLAATVAHELRNPLAAIAMAAYNVRKKAQLPIIDKHLDTIEKKVNESDHIINNLLFYSRLKPPNLEKIDAADMLEECIETLEKQLKKDVRIVRDTAAEDMLLAADLIQLKEVFNNILNNALDAVPVTGGEIRVSTASDADVIKITIKDNGSGIDGSIINKVFDPFFTTKAKGTGLGLFVCQQIITMHKGKIEITSEQGKGTVVKIRLPKTLLRNKNV